MPAQPPESIGPSAESLADVGAALRRHREDLGLSMVRTAEMAGVSRVTLHRIERGSASVTAGAYANVATALGVALTVAADAGIAVARYPQLRLIAWNRADDAVITPDEAFNLYERNWRHVDQSRLSDQEQQLIDHLTRTVGQGHLLV